MQVEAKHMHVLPTPKHGCLAICDVTVGGEFAIKGVRVMQGEKGPFVSLPQYKDKDGKYQDVVFPITAEGRKALNDAVLQVYREHTQEKAVEAAR
jgi:stage V sporulation protein G